MDRETALRKVYRCLRLAGSSNPNEAATALRQARSLMDQYGLTEADAYSFGIHDADAPTRCRGATPPQSLVYLLTLVAVGFRCQSVIQRSRAWTGTSKTTIRFYGAGSDAQVAAYAFTVLRRQLDADRAKYTARIRKRANKEARGEEFATGWVHAVSRLFPAAEISDEQLSAIDAKMRSIHGELTTTSGREIGKHGSSSWRDRDAGYIAGSRARLNQGLGESAQRKLEHVS